MMKKITFLFFLISSLTVFSQTVLEDFEGTLPTGALVGDSGMATTPEVVADPATGGDHGNVLKIVTSADGNGWQNAQLFFQGSNLDLTTSDKVVTVDIYSESAFNMLAKTASPLNGGAESATDAAHTGSGWETLTFDFSDSKDNTPVANDVFGRILFFPQWSGSGWNTSSVTTTYVDNIKGIAAGEDTCSNNVQDGDETGIDCGGSCNDACPTTSAVILEDFEGTLPTGALVGDSGMATTPEVVADPATGGDHGNVLKIVTSADGNGWQNAQLFFQGSNLDLTTSDKVVTVDIYSESAFNMLAKTASPLNGGAESATDAAHTGSGWETLTFDFSDSKDNTPVANDVFGRILFFPQWSGSGWNTSSVTTTYVDNIKGIAAATANITDNVLLNVSIYPNPTTSRLIISAPNTIKSAAIYNILGKQVLSLNINKNSESVDVSNLATGMYLIKYSIDNAVGTAKFIKQ